MTKMNNYFFKNDIKNNYLFQLQMSDVRIKLPINKEKRRCNSCGFLLSITMFRFRNKANNIRLTQCKICHDKKANEKRYEYEDTKKCIKCKHILSIDDFDFRSKKTGRLQARCKECIKLTLNKKKKSESHKNWYYNKGGRELVRQKNQEYKPIRNAKNRKKSQDDINYRFVCNVRNRIYQSLRQNGQRRINKIKYLGMSQRTYFQWLEYQFDEKMTQENYGTYWEIDHVIPIDSFNLNTDDDTEIYTCFDWKNTRPLSKVENNSKRAIVDQNLILEHTKVVHSFILSKYLEGKFVDNDRYSDYTSELYGL